MATGVPFDPPDHDEFRAVSIKLHGNAKAIAKHFNIIPHTLYSYFKRDPKAKEILDEIRGYNSFTDVDLAEYVNRYNMSMIQENPAVAQRAAEFTLTHKGRGRDWNKEDLKDKSSDDEDISLTLVMAKENSKLREELKLLKEKYGIDEPQTGTEHISSQQEIEYLVRSCEVGEDI